MDLYATSVEYAKWIITADVDLDGPVQVAFTAHSKAPGEDATWHPAAWVGDPAPTRTCRLLVAGADAAAPADAISLPAGLHGTWVRLQDTPEVVIRRAGTVYIR